ncbi:MAG: VWA domain-containing protein [Myxococcales bacterium]|nr:VWA domain-containing protein [Polyangiaceae bacterium]MDW8250766.1 VWA domain-containing protein [Myxococcales bacterium]
MPFQIEAFQNRYLAPEQRRVEAILTVTASGELQTLPQLVVGFLLDKSGSMQGDRIQAVIRAVNAAISLLDERSWFFLIGFDSTASVLLRDGQATEEHRRAAAAALATLHAAGGTAMSTGLRAARAFFERYPDAIRHAIFLTDGKNESEPSSQVAQELACCEGLFQCDCWGVGTDWKVGEVQEIARVLLGRAALIPDPQGVEAAFRASIQKARGKAYKGVRLRFWTPQTATLLQVQQVAPSLDDLTDRLRPAGPQLQEVATGAWSPGESRDFHVVVEVQSSAVGNEMLALRPSVAYEEPTAAGWTSREDRSPQGRVIAQWCEVDLLTARVDEHVAYYKGQSDLAQAIRQGLEQQEAGNEVAATQLLGRAVRLAHATQNTEMTQRLARVVEVLDPVQGTVRLRRDARKAATMELQLESSFTQRLIRPPAKP